MVERQQPVEDAEDQPGEEEGGEEHEEDEAPLHVDRSVENVLEELAALVLHRAEHSIDGPRLGHDALAVLLQALELVARKKSFEIP